MHSSDIIQEKKETDRTTCKEIVHQNIHQTSLFLQWQVHQVSKCFHITLRWGSYPHLIPCLILFVHNFTPSKLIKSLRCKRLPRVKETEENGIVGRERGDIERPGFKKLCSFRIPALTKYWGCSLWKDAFKKCSCLSPNSKGQT